MIEKFIKITDTPDGAKFTCEGYCEFEAIGLLEHYKNFISLGLLRQAQPAKKKPIPKKPKPDKK